MEGLVTLLVMIFCLGSIYIVIAGAIKVKKDSKQKKEDIKRASINVIEEWKNSICINKDFDVDDIYIHTKGKTGFAIDTKNSKIMLITPDYQKIINYNNLVSVELLENKNTLATTNRGSQIVGTVAGGILLGGVGAVIGGLSGSKSSKDIITKISVRLITDDFYKPNHEVDFMDISVESKGVNRENSIYKNSLDEAIKWHSRFSIVLKKEEENSKKSLPESIRTISNINISVADEIAKLSKLQKEGAITIEEFESQKKKLLGL